MVLVTTSLHISLGNRNEPLPTFRSALKVQRFAELTGTKFVVEWAMPTLLNQKSLIFCCPRLKCKLL